MNKLFTISTLLPMDNDINLQIETRHAHWTLHTKDLFLTYLATGNNRVNDQKRKSLICTNQDNAQKIACLQALYSDWYVKKINPEFPTVRRFLQRVVHCAFTIANPSQQVFAPIVTFTGIQRYAFIEARNVLCKTGSKLALSTMHVSQ